MIIVGAGMAGLLAANMLQRRKPLVVEKQTELPNNHSAVLRFRSSVVGDVLGIAFRKVNMIKCPVYWRNPVSDSLAYSYKCTGQYLSNRSITSGLIVEERYIAPPDLIATMAEGATIEYNRDWETIDDFAPVISTLPMPVLMRILKYPDMPKFYYVSGINIKATIADCDAFASLLIPDPDMPMSRISLTGNELIIELPRLNVVQFDLDNVVAYSASLLGLALDKVTDIDLHRQQYSKIIAIPDDERKRFIAWATDENNIYSLGRYATWRPSLLLDDLVKDIRAGYSLTGEYRPM
jgi:hypothetical protein